ncbi:hypothetical protein [Photorhabdus cinerea]|uniref:Uncharacterized protein n=1 Tax=Photorhabdus cinerea TaxID=471575 RepID=A0A7X5QAP1_9GAMM|nr:hypothetical protein [Photorhabdus cinerea]NHB90802.1 hypothetical protein [Photorhabdus cinerea]
MNTLIKIMEKFSSRPLFFIFSGLTLCNFLSHKSALKDPSIENILILLTAMCIIVFIMWGFEWLVNHFNYSLQENDRGDIGSLIGTAALAIYIVNIFHFLSENSNTLSLKMLTQPNFIYSTTLLLFALETMKMSRFKQR